MPDEREAHWHDDDDHDHDHDADRGDSLTDDGSEKKKKKKRRKDRVLKFVPGPIEGLRLLTDLDPRHASIDNPRWMPVAGEQQMRPEDFVLGLVIDDEPYAMPWWIMKNHHLLNIDFGGQPFFICLCEACSTGAAFTPVVRGRRLRFDLGGDYNGSFCIRDRETGSIWAPFMGLAVWGELEGERLEPLPLIQTTWEEWKQLYDGGYVLNGQGESREGHGSGHYPGTFENNSFYRNALHHDDRLTPGHMILGVENNGSSRAYSLAGLSPVSPALNQELGGEPIVIFCRPDSLIAIAFSRAFDGRVLTFAGSGDRITDKETGSEWNFWGEALRGPLAGARLGFVRSYIEEWYAWFTMHPQTELWQQDPSHI